MKPIKAVMPRIKAVMSRIKVVMSRIGSRDETDKSRDETDPRRDFWESSAIDAGCTALRRVKIGTIGTMGKPFGESVKMFRKTEIVVGNGQSSLAVLPRPIEISRVVALVASCASVDPCCGLQPSCSLRPGKRTSTEHCAGFFNRLRY